MNTMSDLFTRYCNDVHNHLTKEKQTRMDENELLGGHRDICGGSSASHIERRTVRERRGRLKPFTNSP